MWDEGFISYRQPELFRIHRHFYHPQPDRIYNLMKRAADPDAASDTLKRLEDLSSRCYVCQRLSKGPGRLRVSLPAEDIVFNRVVYMDIMTLSGKTVIHFVDRDTLFSAATFLTKGEKSKHVWDAFLGLWVRPCVGYPDRVHEDQGPQFQSAG